MAAQYKTQCPHCGAQFRISEQHLAQAKGAVRCGACLKIFQATEHLVSSAPATKPVAKPAPQAPAQAKPAASAEEWTLPASDKPAAPPKPATRWTMDDLVEDDDTEDSIPDKLHDDPAPSNYQPNDTKLSLGSLELSDSFMSLDEDDESSLGGESFSDMAGAGRKNQGDDSDESWAEKLLEELDEADKPAPVPVRADLMSLTEREEEEARKKKAAEKKQRTAAAKPAKSDSPDWAMDSGDFFSDSGGGLFDDEPGGSDIEAIDLPQVEPARTQRPAMQHMESLSANSNELIKWGALSLAALLILGIQYLSFNYQELARTPSWRPFYANICGAVGCSLPNPSDVQRLRGANLVVRSHPAVEEALIVDVIIFNEARHPQPFPILELGFTSLSGRAVASRRFNPDEYLDGDLKGMSAMPTDTPMRVSLEILDPGSEAVNYTLRFIQAPERS